MTNVPIAAIKALGHDWHGAGTVPDVVLDGLVALGAGGFARSVETGTGRTTLVLSHLSRHHTVFTKADDGDGDSLSRVRSSELLEVGKTVFVVGPTQRTIVRHDFGTEPIDCAYIDGPHAWPFPELEYWSIYPHLRTGALLIIDDVNVPTIANMFEILRADAMYDLVDVIENTAFFRRTSAPAVDPFGEGFWLQGYNAGGRYGHLSRRGRAVVHAKRRTPDVVKRFVKRRVEGRR